jgi:cholesterol oxidase
MTTGTLGFTFSETMSGGIALGETDPQRGLAAGNAAHTVLDMHNTILIDDLDRFISDPDHLASISGSIDWPPFGRGIPCPRGVFNLFSPTTDPALKLMIYELAFEHDGKPYYMAGHKEVRIHPLLDLWKDTTTLYSQIHQSPDKSGPVVAAGIVSLSPLQLMKMVGTFRAVNASGPAQAAEAVSKFGSFFMGELWETYVRKAAGGVL